MKGRVVAGTLAVVLIGAAASVYNLADSVGDSRGGDAQPGRMDSVRAPVEVEDLDQAFARLDLKEFLEPDVRPSESAPVVGSVPVDLPFAQSRPMLSELADAGDAEANCRLAMELAYCAASGDLPTVMADALIPSVANMRSSSQDRMVEALAATKERVEGRSLQCKDVGSIEEDEIEARARFAAQRGSTRARVLYALRAPGGAVARLRRPSGITLDEPSPTGRLPTFFYAEHAVEYLNEGLSSFDPLALEGLILIHTPRRLGRPNELPIWMPNPLRFWVLTEIYSRLGLGPSFPRDIEALRQLSLETLPPEILAQAQKLVEGEVTRWEQRNPRPVGGESPDRICNAP